jgi:hypothetical protein
MDTIFRNILLSSAYLGSVEYYALISRSDVIWIDIHEHFHKQTYRNRCIIAGANGLVSLVIPVSGARRSKTPMKEVKISYDTPWQRIHWKTIVSAYSSSPYFQYFEDDFFPYYEKKKWHFLVEFNNHLMEKVMELTGLTAQVCMTSAFEATDLPLKNLREAINPFTKASSNDNIYEPKPYTQVFGDKHGYIPNLSMIDLLFNTGPDSSDFLKQGRFKI